jgi:GTP 3',8-cyclase
MSKNVPTSQDPWFTVVEIEVNSRCNRNCSYCPVSLLPTPAIERYMSELVFDRVISELVRINFDGKLSYHFYNEPLLRSDLNNLVDKAARSLPWAYQLLFTNGDLLTDERYACLKAAGIDHFFVTRHNFVSIPERQDQTIQFPTDLVLTNRGGILGPLAGPLTRPCFAPTEMLIITIDGDVVLCCDDAERSNVMGNIISQSLEDIWFSPDFKRIRKLLQAGNRSDASAICRLCNNQEYFAPGEGNKNHLRKENPTSRG